jgi:hypothetical protein
MYAWWNFAVARTLEPMERVAEAEHSTVQSPASEHDKRDSLTRPI